MTVNPSTAHSLAASRAANEGGNLVSLLHLPPLQHTLVPILSALLAGWLSDLSHLSSVLSDTQTALHDRDLVKQRLLLAFTTLPSKAIRSAAFPPNFSCIWKLCTVVPFSFDSNPTLLPGSRARRHTTRSASRTISSLIPNPAQLQHPSALF